MSPSTRERVLGIELALPSIREAIDHLRLAMHWLSGTALGALRADVASLEARVDQLTRLAAALREREEEEVEA